MSKAIELLLFGRFTRDRCKQQATTFTVGKLERYSAIHLLLQFDAASVLNLPLIRWVEQQ
jgi:hypothetical protein